MKNIYILLLCLLNVAAITAQPVITNSWAPSGNFSSNFIVTSNAVSHNAGASGANCTWNMTSWSSATNFNSVDTCSFTPNTDFPGSTDLTTESNTSYTNYIYHKLTGTVYQNLGNHYQYTSGDYDHFSFHTPIDLFHFPINYNDQFVTSGYYYRDWTYGSSAYTSHGTVFILVSADGYGTLNTPMGSFTNVMRIHTQENYTDTVDVAWQTWNVTQSSTDRYDWIAANKPGIILASTAEYLSVNGPNYYSYYAHVSPSNNTGIDEMNNAQVSLSIFPQPANGQTKAIISSKKNKRATMIITDVQGRTMLNQDVDLQAGENGLPVDVKEFPNGIYLLSIRSDEAVSTQRFIVSNQ